MPDPDSVPNPASPEADPPEPSPTGDHPAQPIAAGLPVMVPDFVEQELAEELDNIIPTRGYQMTPMVALGGSAGCIPALQHFFQTMPADSGLVFIVILHLSPTHLSNLAELLGRTTPMTVAQAEDGMKVYPDRVYVIPPGKHLATVDGHLRLTDLETERGKRVAVDLFFRSLADTHGPHSAAIVLSGAGGDGAIGLKRIKERGGLTIAQDPDEAEYPSMPRTSIDTGMVDWVLEIAQMSPRLLKYFRQETALRLPSEDGPQPALPAAASSAQDEESLRNVLIFLRTRTGRDFSYYKRATIVRRIARRMQVNSVDSLAGYLGFLRTHPGESGALLQDLLISVTNFFRDRDSFDALEKHIPALFEGKGPNDAVRVWVPACATGEEAYSIAILLLEHARHLALPPALQIFACDLDEDAIAEARTGLYTPSISADVSEERLARFFIKDPRGYRVRREVREMVLFAAHDLLKDAPFSRVDLVSCRNLLIYLNHDAQHRAVDTFHFALRPGGHLFLGASETVDEASPLFRVLDKKHRVYQSKITPRQGLPVPMGPSNLGRLIEAQNQALVTTPVVHGLNFDRPRNPSPVTITPRMDRATLAEVHFKVLERLSPPSAIVNAEHDIVHLSEHMGRFLRVAGGEPTTNLLRLVDPALRIELRSALLRAAENKADAEAFGVPVVLEGQPGTVDLFVTPVHEAGVGFLLVVFKARPAEPSPEPAAGPGEEGTSARGALPVSDGLVRQFERELEATKSQLRDTVEQYEASTEEMKASNEELQAMNEELRSASEELETSREELQSINEELTTVNLEMKSKVEELALINGDLQNLMASTNIATIFLDRELVITRYTPSAVALFNLIPTDVGRPLTDLKNRLEYPSLEEDAQRVLRELIPVGREVGRVGDDWFLARLLPYRSVDERISGVVLTFIDISARKQAESALAESETQFRSFMKVSSDSVYQMNPDWTVMRLLEGKDFLADTLDPSRSWLETYIPPEDRPLVLTAIYEAMRSKTIFELEHRVIRAGGDIAWTMSRAVPLLNASGEIASWIGTATDVTGRKRADEALRESEEKYRTLFESIDQGFYFAEAIFDDEGRCVDMIYHDENPAAVRLTGRSFKGRRLSELGGYESYWLDILGETARTGQPQRREEYAQSNGVWYDFYVFKPTQARANELAIIFTDVTVRQRSQEALRRSEETLQKTLHEAEQARNEAQAANVAKDHFLAVLSHELRTPLMPIQMALGTLSHLPNLPAPVRSAHEMIARNVELEARFIDDMLDVTRIARGKMEIVRAPMDLHEAAQRAVEVSSSDLEAKRQRLTVALDATNHGLNGDFARLQQAMWNLLKNASKFTPQGGEISLRTYNEPEKGVVNVEVADSGIGLDAGALERIFNPFEQADASITQQFGGLGLGLAIAKGTVEAHGGSLHAHSAGRGQGATFTLCLPL